MNEVEQRWQGFVAKCTERLQMIMTESDAGFAGMLADPELDPIAFTNAMNAIEIRYKDLRTKLANTFSEQVAIQLNVGMGPARKLLEDTDRWMEDTFERWRVGWGGKHVRAMWPRVQASMHKPVMCSKCGGALTRKVFHQAESIPCTHCGGVNSVTPDTIVYTYFAMAPHAVADEATIHLKLGAERAQSRGVGRGELERIYREYWTAHAAAQAQIMPMPPEEQQRYVESRIAQLVRYM